MLPSALISLHTDIWWNLALAVAEILVFYFLGSLAQKFVFRLAERAKNRGVWTFFASFMNIFCKVIGVIIALDQLGVSMNLIIGALSALGVGISLALKDNMASVAGGLQLLLTKPFKVGDYIKMGKHEGQVRSIEMTFTVLNTRNNETVIIPNNSLIIKTVVNFSSEPERRVVITYPSKTEDITKNEKELLIAAKASNLVLKNPEPSVRITSYQIDQATLELLAYTNPENYWNCSSQIMSNIHLLQTSGLIDTGQARELSSSGSQESTSAGSSDNSTEGTASQADSPQNSNASEPAPFNLSAAVSSDSAVASESSQAVSSESNPAASSASNPANFSEDSFKASSTVPAAGLPSSKGLNTGEETADKKTVSSRQTQNKPETKPQENIKPEEKENIQSDAGVQKKELIMTANKTAATPAETMANKIKPAGKVTVYIDKENSDENDPDNNTGTNNKQNMTLSS